MKFRHRQDMGIKARSELETSECQPHILSPMVGVPFSPQNLPQGTP